MRELPSWTAWSAIVVAPMAITIEFCWQPCARFGGISLAVAARKRGRWARLRLGGRALSYCHVLAGEIGRVTARPSARRKPPETDGLALPALIPRNSGSRRRVAIGPLPRSGWLTACRPLARGPTNRVWPRRSAY